DMLLLRAQSLLETDPTAALKLLGSYPKNGADQPTAQALAIEARERGVAHAQLATDTVYGAFSPDGTRFASVEGGSIKVWDSRSGRVMASFKAASGVRWVRFFPSGDRLLVGRPRSGELDIVDLATGAVRTLRSASVYADWAAPFDGREAAI